MNQILHAFWFYFSLVGFESQKVFLCPILFFKQSALRGSAEPSPTETVRACVPVFPGKQVAPQEGVEAPPFNKVSNEVFYNKIKISH